MLPKGAIADATWEWKKKIEAKKWRQPHLRLKWTEKEGETKGK